MGCSRRKDLELGIASRNVFRLLLCGPDTQGDRARAVALSLLGPNPAPQATGSTGTRASESDAVETRAGNGKELGNAHASSTTSASAAATAPTSATAAGAAHAPHASRPADKPLEADESEDCQGAATSRTDHGSMVQSGGRSSQSDAVSSDHPGSAEDDQDAASTEADLDCQDAASNEGDHDTKGAAQGMSARGPHDGRAARDERDQGHGVRGEGSGSGSRSGPGPTHQTWRNESGAVGV